MTILISGNLVDSYAGVQVDPKPTAATDPTICGDTTKPARFGDVKWRRYGRRTFISSPLGNSDHVYLRFQVTHKNTFKKVAVFPTRNCGLRKGTKWNVKLRIIYFLGKKNQVIVAY